MWFVKHIPPAWLAVMALLSLSASAIGQPLAVPEPPDTPSVGSRQGTPGTLPGGPSGLCVPSVAGCGVPNTPACEETWLCRPCSVGWFLGMVQSGPLVADWVGLTQGFQGGVRLGLDCDNTWGIETRFAYAATELYDSRLAKLTLSDADTQAGYAADSPFRHRFDHRNADMFQWDVDALYYPWGENRWRPYLLWGLGLTDVRFTDLLTERYHKLGFSMPLGLGLKYHCNNALALRLECIDDIAFLGDGFQTLNNVSLTAGMEVRFGGPRRTYWPWNLGGRW
jgi:hypothetical protein